MARRSLSGSDVVNAGLPGKFCTCVLPSPMSNHRTSCPIYFYKDLGEIDREERAAAEKAATTEEFQGGWASPAPKFTATPPKVTSWSEGT